MTLKTLFGRFAPLALLGLALLGTCTRLLAGIPELWAERINCTVAVEYMIEAETERRENLCYGMVVNKEGVIALPPLAINLHFTPEQLKQFKVYLPGEDQGTPAEYLGPDPLSGWHYVKADQETAQRLRPVTDFINPEGTKAVGLTDEVWGIGLRGKDEDFLPYVMTSRVALINKLPQTTAVAQREVTAPGLPVFNEQGDLVGVGLSSFGQSYIQFSRLERGGAAVMLVNAEESSAFLIADEAIPLINRIPHSPFGRPMPWLGTFGLQPIEPEVAKLLKLEKQSAAVISEVLENSPAEKAGLKERDIIIEVDGTPLPRFRPSRAVINYLEREVNKRAPGDSMKLTVLREGARTEVTATLAEAPRLAREASRRFFEKLGFTGRECVYSDAIMRRAKAAEVQGLIIHYVKGGSPAASAGLMTEDWVKQIDGTEITTTEDAFALLEAIQADKTRNDFVMLVSRGGDTSIIRIKLK